MWSGSRYVLLVSGLGMGSSWCDQLSLEMFVDYVTGQLGGVSVTYYISHLSSLVNEVSYFAIHTTISPI